MSEREPSLADAFALVEAHRKSGCLHVAVDYAERTRGADRDTLKRGVAYVVASLEKKQQQLKG